MEIFSYNVYLPDKVGKMFKTLNEIAECSNDLSLDDLRKYKENNQFYNDQYNIILDLINEKNEKSQSLMMSTKKKSLWPNRNMVSVNKKVSTISLGNVYGNLVKF